MNSKRETIYVPLLDEGIDVWRPVLARRISGDSCLILDQDYDRDVETWDFEPGTVVKCRKEERDSRRMQVATEVARRHRLRPGQDADRPVAPSRRRRILIGCRSPGFLCRGT